METQCTPALFVGKSRKNIIFESPSLCLERFEYTSSIDGTKDWFVYHHEGTGKDCILILHGHGSHGDQLLKKPEWIALWERNVKKYNCNLLSPNLRDDAWMCPAAADDLTMILKAGLREKLWRRIIIIAGSMGASGGLIYAMRHPELIAGIAALGAATDIKSYQLWCDKAFSEQSRRKALSAVLPLKISPLTEKRSKRWKNSISKPRISWKT